MVAGTDGGGRARRPGAVPGRRDGGGIGSGLSRLSLHVRLRLILPVSAICVRLHPQTRTAEYVNAGHPAGLVVAAGGGVTRLDSSAPLVHPELANWARVPDFLHLRARKLPR